DGKLWLLQSRPITTLAGKPDPDAPRRIWDNSNIAESYSGVTTPLTYTFARRAYENVYRQFCLIMNVPKDRVAKSDAVFKAMIGFIRGRIYYNLVSWYRVLALLPGFRLNRAFMEQMMGVKEPMPPEIVAEIENDNTTSRFRDGLDLANTLGGLIREHWRLPRSIRDFHARLADALVETSPTWQPEDWVAHYRDLEHKLLTRWDAPLVNDFLAMIFCGVLRKLTTKWCDDESGALANGLLRDVGEVISVEPARRIRAMAEKKANGENINDDVAAYLKEFGDRCMEELKLESQTLCDDPNPLMISVEAMSKRVDAKVEPMPEVKVPQMPGRRRIIFNWVLKHARGRVRDRENLRFERTRVFGRVRQIVRTLGDRLAEQGLLSERDDVFYLHLEEIVDHFEHTSAQPITPELIATRKAEFAEYRAEDPPPDRFETFGPPGAYREFEDLLEAQQLLDGDLKGTGACAGRVRGPVRVVTDPRGVTLEPGEILVAQQTDPGWVTLFPAASGLLVERGSLLSHSAIVAREMGIPAIVSIQSITKILEDGQEVEMDGETGTIRVLN
ncbi:MAG: PEP-utilizing enzyme, partial [Verrucomicrobiota bacterium]